MIKPILQRENKKKKLAKIYAGLLITNSLRAEHMYFSNRRMIIKLTE